uniref:Uncharacterized protein n=1 Tax=Dendroctonus ponderosae TaxID=77166 RepID=A0AAR5PUH6_DENPD
MTRWVGERPKIPPGPPDPNTITDDPLAALGLTTLRGKSRSKEQVYSVSRINPLFNLHSSHMQCQNSSASNSSTGLKAFKSCKNQFKQDDKDSLRSHTNSSEYSSIPMREKTPEIDYDDGSLPREAPASDYFQANHYSHDLPRGQSESSSFLGGQKMQVRDKSTSSGYGGSNGGSSVDHGFHERLRPVEEAGVVLDQNSAFVKSIRIAGRGLKPIKSVPSQHSSSSGGGTLSTIPEGKVDVPVPQPIWPGYLPLDHRNLLNSCVYDSLVDEALLLYTNLGHQHQLADHQSGLENYLEVSVEDLLMDLLASINRTLKGESGCPEEMLKVINEKIKLKLDALKNNTEDEMRRLCVNLSNNRKVNSVIRAFSHSSSSGRSSLSGRVRTSSSNDEDIYHIPSGSSSSGFSDSPPGQRRTTTLLLPQLHGWKPSILPSRYCEHDSTLTRGIRNALIYGTLGRHKITSINQSLCCQKPMSEENQDSLAAREETVLHMCDSGEQKQNLMENRFSSARNIVTGLKSFNCDRNGGVVKGGSLPKGGLLKHQDDRPSVWQLYYGMKAEGSKQYGEGKPTDVPVFPGGRPEADFTLDVPRSELLSKRLREDKKWRFRCRVLTSFLGLVFFLLSVMAVSMILTRGKRMFGSMV